MKEAKIKFSTFMWLVFLTSTVWSQTAIYDTGGSLMPEQACYDVRYYDLALFVNPADSSIDGSVQINADIVHPIDWLVVDLDTLLKIHKIVKLDIAGEENQTSYHRKVGKIWIYLGRTHQPGESVRVKIYYGGKPRVAPRPPWDGGFTWARTASGSPWIATTCEGEGPDIWWPCKDHVSDEPDSMGIHIRVPEPLVCASNGRLRSVEKHPDHTTTYHWFVSTPINNYDVALNIAPYKLIKKTYKSVTGEKFPVMFWVLPEDYEKGQAFMPEILKHLRFFEELLGPYPFRADKYGVVQTPHLGMEHQTIIAYGANFNNSAMTRKDWGFDALHHHELSHEWWGNMVTNADWKDMWLHEGFASYMQALYLEKIGGKKAYHDYLNSIRHSFTERYAIAPRESQTGKQIYRAPIYMKGAWVLHTLRYLIGDAAFFKALRRMAYPDPAMEKITDGRQTRFATTDDFLQIAEQASGQPLDWFFEVYLRQPKLPQLVMNFDQGKLKLRWKVPDGLSFPMPLDVRVDGQLKRLTITEQGTEVAIRPDSKIDLDPENWVLFNLEALASGRFYTDRGEYEKARSQYEKILRIYPDNYVAQKMMQHINYAEKNHHKMASDFFNDYLGKYQISANNRVIVSRENNAIYLQRTRRSKLRIYPISDNELILPSFKRHYIFVKDKDGHVTELVIKSEDGSVLSRAKRVGSQ